MEQGAKECIRSRTMMKGEDEEKDEVNQRGDNESRERCGRKEEVDEWRCGARRARSKWSKEDEESE